MTQFFYDWRNRLIATKAGVEGTEATSVNRPLTYVEYDNLGQVIAQEQYDGDAVMMGDGDEDGVPDKPSSSLLRARTTAEYDDRGRFFQTDVYSVNQSTGVVSTDSLTTSSWFDRRGLVVKTEAPGGLVTKPTQDGAGRVTKKF